MESAFSEQQQKQAARDFGEAQAGIEEYLSPGNVTIQCAIKHRFSDFIVNEIDEHGQVIWFSPERDLQKWKRGGPEEPKPVEGGAGEEQKEPAEEAKIGLDEQQMEELKKLLSEEDFTKFNEYLEGVNEGAIEKTTLFTCEENIEDKGRRSAIHVLFKATPVFETDTLMEKDSRRIRVFLKNSLSQNKRRKLNIINRKPADEKEQPQYLQVVIQKTNVDTMQAVHYIAKRIKKYGKHFQIAGNKDKRGITTQRATVIRGNPESLIRFQRARDWDNKIKVGSFEWVKEPLRLGQLSGNRFSVALRFIPKEISAEEIAGNVERLKANGFINYFGMQRFGTYNVRTHEICKENLH